MRMSELFSGSFGWPWSDFINKPAFTGSQLRRQPIGRNQGIQFPIAEVYAQLQVLYFRKNFIHFCTTLSLLVAQAAALMVETAAKRYENGESIGAEANMVCCRHCRRRHCLML